MHSRTGVFQSYILILSRRDFESMAESGLSSMNNNTLKPCGQTSTRPDLPPPNKDIRNRALCTNQSFAWRNNTKETKEQIQAAGPAEVAAVTNNNDPAEEKDRVCLCWKLLRQITETANLATLDPAVERTYKLCDNSVYLGVSCSPDFAQCIMDDLFRSLEDVHCYLDDFGAWSNDWNSHLNCVSTTYSTTNGAVTTCARRAFRRCNMN
mmetsp:Transcript_11188/g.30881  ORF Transcript_11188/g.30881 Transcript_11188/m.30881 type:complete len:209 (-) Transcript_11188:3610-4236(-)